MKVKVLRPFWFEGVVRSAGALVDLPDHLGREVVYGGKAERVLSPTAEAPKPAPEIKQTMTTKTAGALAGKKGD